MGPDGRIITGLEGEKRKEYEENIMNKREKVTRTRDYADYVRANAAGPNLQIHFRNPKERQRLVPLPLNDYVDESISSYKSRGRNAPIIQSASVQSLPRLEPVKVPRNLPPPPVEKVETFRAKPIIEELTSITI